MKRCSLILCGLMLACPVFAQQAVAAIAAMLSHLEYDVLKNGEPVGQQVMDFSSSGGTVSGPDFDKRRRQNGLYYRLSVRAFELGAVDQGALGITDLEDQ